MKNSREIAKYQSLKHEFLPVFDENSKVLILGTFPSVKSREEQFFYGHKQNRFWKVLAQIVGEDVPQSIEEKKAMLLRNNIAIWDVISSCDIIGSSDSSIKNVVPSDLSIIFDNAEIRQVFANGTTAKKLYDKYQLPIYQKEILLLPSTSPANAAFSLDKLIKKWTDIAAFLNL